MEEKIILNLLAQIHISNKSDFMFVKPSLITGHVIWYEHMLCLKFLHKEIFFQYVQNNKTADNDWFRLESNKEGTRWFGKCWFIHNLLKYEFDIEFDVSKCLFYYIQKHCIILLLKEVCIL